MTKLAICAFALMLVACGGDDETATHDALTVIANPDTIAIVQGAVGSVEVLIERTGKFASADVALSATGLPDGVVAAFDTPVTNATFATMSLTVDSAATPGDYPLTIAGASSGSTESAQLDLTVTARRPGTVH